MAVVAFLLATPAAAQTVVDGDTIKHAGVTWRLWGIDAPENKQTCADGWPAGVEARRMLGELVTLGEIACEERARDRYGRTVGICRSGGIDIQAEMVRRGMAWAFIRYSSDYVIEERQAAAARLGVHNHDCEKPWDWRAKKGN